MSDAKEGDYQTIDPTGVVRVESGRTYEPGPMFGGTPDYLTIRELMLRLCGQRWGLPEHIYSPPDDVQPDHVVG